MNNRYVLLTAAKDEAACIGEVIQYVVSQTVKPVAWFIIDDGSTDRTAAIVESFAAKHPFIKLQSASARSNRNFGSQYKALRAAYDLAQSLEFDFVAIQDADQAPERQDYYESILTEFQKNPRLGGASGVIYERSRGKWEFRSANAEDALAASTVWRRTAFDEVGGYTPMYYQGTDWLIQLQMKMAGWALLTRPDLHILHYRPTSSAGGIWRGRYHAGLSDASFGSHPIFEMLKCGRRLTTHPVILGSLVRFWGYLWWHMSGRKPIIKPDEVAFLRQEQCVKMRRWMGLTSGAPIGKPGGPKLA
jgi:cellulose synthase/poly-beta-1,6-N-acetylglucosamine synthase-like glycosyltransferase